MRNFAAPVVTVITSPARLAASAFRRVGRRSAQQASGRPEPPPSVPIPAWGGPPPYLSHYQIKERVGAGGMGTVYRAVDRRSGAVVAVKVLHSHLESNPTYLERFHREAKIAALLDSPYMVRIIDSGSDQGYQFIVSEFVPGAKLGDLLRDGKLEPVQALAIAAQVASALEEAARQGVVHRDIKPDNMMFTERGAIKVADFGISRLADATTVTVTGMFVGTLAYTAPEQARGRADTRSDIYSLGITLFEMLTGEVPFHAETPTGLMRMHEEDRPPLENLKDMPEPVVAVVKRCLEKDPADRFQHPSELLGAIEGARRALAPELSDTWMATVASTLVETRIEALERTRVAAAGVTVPLEAGVAAAAGAGEWPERAGGGGPPRRRFPPFALGWFGGESRVPILAAVIGAVVLLGVIGIGGALALSGGGSSGNGGGGGGDIVRGSATPSPRPTPAPSPSATPVPTPAPETPAPVTPGPPLDSDGDGVTDVSDQCRNTPRGTRVDAKGCPLPPPDSDGDGVPNDRDQCGDTPRGTQVDGNGCPVTPPDSDGDGVPDSGDQCRNTPRGTPVDANGCPLGNPDSDGDGVFDPTDTCPGTPPNLRPVNTSGCPDRDGDGLFDDADRCPEQPASGNNGCPTPGPTPPPISPEQQVVDFFVAINLQQCGVATQDNPNAVNDYGSNGTIGCQFQQVGAYFNNWTSNSQINSYYNDLKAEVEHCGCLVSAGNWTTDGVPGGRYIDFIDTSGRVATFWTYEYDRYANALKTAVASWYLDGNLSDDRTQLDSWWRTPGSDTR